MSPQAICHTCWNAKHPDQPSNGLNPGYMEVCSYCGEDTCSGIYVRDDPASVPFPAEDD